MSRLDCSSAEVKAALEDVSSPTSKNEWAVFGYVPKSGNVIKVDSKGSGFDDMVEEFSEGKVQFAYYRVPVKGASKFVYVAWCGDGVSGMAKGNFANHSNDFAAHLKKGFAVHHQVNARSEADLDEKKIQAALVKAAGANYDAGAKKQGMDSTAKAMGELKHFHISEQERAVQTGTSGTTGVQIDKTASDAFWQANKNQPKAPAAAPSKPAVDEEARKAFWQQQQQEQAAAKAAAAKQPASGRPAPAGRVNAAAFNNPPPSSAPPSSAPPAARPAPGKINTSAFTKPPPATSAPPPGRPAPGKLSAGGPPPVPSSQPPSLPPSQPPSLPPSQPPSLPAHAPPTSAPPPVSRPAPTAAPLPPRAPEPEDNTGDDGWGDEPAAAPVQQPDYTASYSAPAQEEYTQQDYTQQGYAQEEYAQEEYAAGGQEEYAQEEYAQEEYAQEEYAQEEYAQEEYAQEEYAQEEYAQEEYAQEEYSAPAEGYTQVLALHDYAGSHAEDLTFKAGDWINVYERDESGWWKGELNGVTGYFPSNFVQQ